MKKRWVVWVLAAILVMSGSVYAQETEAVQAQEAETAQAQETEAEGMILMDEAQIGQILDALGNDSIRNTRQYLAEGGTIAEGYRGDAGSGLQQVLVDFGCGISIDGAVGAKTLEALHQVEAAFGLPETNEVDQTLYETLLPLDLLTKGEADADLLEYFEKTGGPGYSDYLSACALAAQGKYYSAREAFESCSYADSSERAQNCVQEFPQSGEIWRNPDIPGSDTSLTFKVHTSDESKGRCFKMFNLDDQVVAIAFVRGSESATVHVPAGTYHMMDGTGYEWYGSEETFGPMGYYEYLTFSEDPDTQYDAWLDYGAYELEINATQLAEGASSVGTSSVGWNDYLGMENE